MPTYYDLVISCPVCLSEGKSGGKPSQWYHGSDCGGKLQIADNGYFRCTDCGVHKHLKNWRYACEEHESDYRPTTSTAFAVAMSISAQIASTAGIKWYRNLLNNLEDDW